MKKLLLLSLCLLMAVFVNAENVTEKPTLNVTVIETVVQSGACIDYDNGNMPYHQGFVQTSEGMFYDACNKETGVVTEFYCAGDSVKSKDFQCMSGCSETYYFSILTFIDNYNLLLNHKLGYCNPTSGYVDFIGGQYGQLQISEGNQDNGQENQSDDNNTEQNETCSTNEDCEASQECIQGNCQETQEPECANSEDCSEGYEFVDGSCQEIIIPPEPECSWDWQCPTSKHCIAGTCQFKHCEHDCQCDWNEFCAGNHCQDVVCHNGIIINHECVKR